MTLEQAESIVNEYQDLLRHEEKRGARRSPSLLPAPKDQVLRAIRMLVARLYYQGLDDEESLKPLIHCAMFLDSFSDEALDGLGFVESMQARRRELLDFYQDLFGIGRNDRFFWQRVYALAGISTETKRSTFFESIKARLGRAVSREAQAEVNEP
jgi:hypothetical protein